MYSKYQDDDDNKNKRDDNDDEMRQPFEKNEQEKFKIDIHNWTSQHLWSSFQYLNIKTYKT